MCGDLESLVEKIRDIMLALGVTALEALGLEVDVVTGNSSLWNYLLALIVNIAIKGDKSFKAIVGLVE